MPEQEVSQQRTKSRIPVNKVELSAPIEWLKDGVTDLKIAKLPSLLYGLVFVIIGLAMLYIARSNPVWSAILVAAFLLTGPFIAIGLYDLSRQIMHGEKPCLLDSVKIINANLAHIGFFAVILSVLIMIWLRMSALIAGVFFNDFELITQGWNVLLDGGRSIEFLLFFALFGFFIAQIIFSISVVSIPMLLHKLDVVTAITTSLRVVIKNPLPMLLWAILIVGMIVLGMMFAFIGLAITLPIVGHASWHAYKALVDYDPGESLYNESHSKR